MIILIRFFIIILINIYFSCKARVRTNPSGDRVSIVDEDHNHGILKERRKKGSLKIVYEQRKLAKERKA